MSGKNYVELLDELDPEERKRVERRAAELIAEERQRETQDRALDQLVAQAQEFGMGYEPGRPEGRGGLPCGGSTPTSRRCNAGDSAIAINVPPYYTDKSKESPMSTEATLTSKGQTTIPKEIREGLRMKTGDRMTFTLLPDGTVLMRVKNKSAMSVAGRLFKKGRKALPIEDLSR